MSWKNFWFDDDGVYYVNCGQCGERLTRREESPQQKEGFCTKRCRWLFYSFPKDKIEEDNSHLPKVKNLVISGLELTLSRSNWIIKAKHRVKSFNGVDCMDRQYEGCNYID